MEGSRKREAFYVLLGHRFTWAAPALSLLLFFFLIFALIKINAFPVPDLSALSRPASSITLTKVLTHTNCALAKNSQLLGAFSCNAQLGYQFGAPAAVAGVRLVGWLAGVYYRVLVTPPFRDSQWRKSASIRMAFA